MKGDIYDPKALIREAYNIDGITASECRTIFLDWALSLPVEMDQKDTILKLLERHGDHGHPMTEVMQEGLQTMAAPRRRGGWQARRRD
ncbi:hypothetical protein [Lentibacter sp. XHP0401]|jgi:hypothetical protein|uniref:hypothetical protein n=1 Tax=Lentibacter sp. XHP0401 TaxID=2984334 RepID=UPI0021E8F1CD|nr:hypothetical protein [Lentibacter sp. XHP0401]MCV2891502.1 hypothetical protein [Lentibacter sp. XHP0401]